MVFEWALSAPRFGFRMAVVKAKVDVVALTESGPPRKPKRVEKVLDEDDYVEVRAFSGVGLQIACCVLHDPKISPLLFSPQNGRKSFTIS